MRAWLSAWQRVHGTLRVTAWSVAAGGRIMRAILILEKRNKRQRSDLVMPCSTSAPGQTRHLDRAPMTSGLPR